MLLQLVGCSHHNSPIEFRERLAFSREQIPLALDRLRQNYPDAEVVLLSTCNRVEIYTGGSEPKNIPTNRDMIEFLAAFHGLRVDEIAGNLFERSSIEAIRHLFSVAASLDSMVMGEAQILSQVKEAYQTAIDGDYTGPLTHAAFQGAIRVARRVASETAIHEKRVSIPSVAVSDFASRIFERFDDKKVLVIGAGEMGEETLNYLVDRGAKDITVINRNFDRAVPLAQRFRGKAVPWEELTDQLTLADLVVSTTGAKEPIVTREAFKEIEARRFQRTLFVLDLAVPRDFDPAIDDCVCVYLYSLDDLKKTCEANQKAREKEWPKAHKIVEHETARLIADWNRRMTVPAIMQLKKNALEVKDQELQRLMNKLGSLDEKTKTEIDRSFDRLVNKLLHPPLESLRDEAEKGAPHSLLQALKHLFQLHD